LRVINRYVGNLPPTDQERDVRIGDQVISLPDARTATLPEAIAAIHPTIPIWPASDGYRTLAAP